MLFPLEYIGKRKLKRTIQYIGHTELISGRGCKCPGQTCMISAWYLWYCYFSFNCLGYYYRTWLESLERLFINFSLRWKVSVWPMCIWYHWKGFQKTKYSAVWIISLLHIVAKLLCSLDCVCLQWPNNGCLDWPITESANRLYNGPVLPFLYRPITGPLLGLHWPFNSHVKVYCWHSELDVQLHLHYRPLIEPIMNILRLKTQTIIHCYHAPLLIQPVLYNFLYKMVYSNKSRTERERCSCWSIAKMRWQHSRTSNLAAGMRWGAGLQQSETVNSGWFIINKVHCAKTDMFFDHLICSIIIPNWLN